MKRQKTNKLHDLFGSLQQSLRAELASAKVHAHGPTAGNAAEGAWVDMLKRHLPARYAADAAFVIDSRGDVSQQIDLVIYDRQYSFRPFEQGGSLYVAAESVYAVFEVKQDLTREHLLDASKKAASVRRLFRTNGAIRSATGDVKKGAAKELPHILGGLLATRCRWRTNLPAKLAAELTKLGSDEQLELGCVAEVGAWSRLADARQSVRVSDEAMAMVDFLLDLLERLRLVGTTPAIEFDVYAERLRA